jgi:hypothetical protein
MAAREAQGGAEDVAGMVSELVEEAQEAFRRVSEELELERRMREQPLAVLGIAAAAGFVLGGGLWPALRPVVRGAVRAALSPANVLAVAAAVGAMRAARQGEEPAAPGAGAGEPDGSSTH